MGNSTTFRIAETPRSKLPPGRTHLEPAKNYEELLRTPKEVFVAKELDEDQINIIKLFLLIDLLNSDKFILRIYETFEQKRFDFYYRNDSVLIHDVLLNSVKQEYRVSLENFLSSLTTN